jgi:Na+/proline symporter
VLLLLAMAGVLVIIALLGWAWRVGQRRAEEYGLDAKSKLWWFTGAGGQGSGMDRLRH